MNGTSTINGRHQGPNHPILVLEPVNDTFALKSLELPENTRVKIGRQTGVATAPHPSNGYFDSKVLSRVHAEVWSESGKVYIRDLKSSNGTFLNGRRLCPENTESEPFELNQSDGLEFGIDIMDENGALLHEKVSCKIYISRMPYPTPGSSPQDAHAKIKSSSPSGSGSNSLKSTSNSNSASVGGQSENLDLIISRLQNELVRSQETFMDLGFLKHGLEDLEKVIFINGDGDSADSKSKDPPSINGLASSGPDSMWTNYEHLLEQRDQDMARLVEDFKVTKEEMISRHEQDLEKLRLDMEASLRSQEQANEALVTATISSVKEESNLSLQKAQKEKEVALAALQAEHQQDITKIIIEADAEKEELINKHKHELAEAVALSTAGVAAAATTTMAAIASSDKTGGDVRAANAELEGLKDELYTLRKAEEEHMQRIEALMQENKKLLQQLEDTKAGLKTQHEAKQPTAVVAAEAAATTTTEAAATTTEAAVADNSSSDPGPNPCPKPLDSTLSTTRL
ncbi:hypothetical protein B0O80DRAFT_421807 [Mortierella sp. GBAus27b]|nr:hypothetical protein B0O80DRAFT_421807 [Mortierella sp. GBAus27b]